MTDALKPLRDAPTTDDLRTPLECALRTCDCSDWSLKQFKPHIRALLARLDAAEADAKRWRKAQSLIAGEHSCCGTRFVFNMLNPKGGANIMQGSVSEHFINAIDAALSSAGGV